MYRCTNMNKCKNTHSTSYFLSVNKPNIPSNEQSDRKTYSKHVIKSTYSSEHRSAKTLDVILILTHPPTGQVQKVWRLWSSGVVREKVINLTARHKNVISNKFGTDHYGFCRKMQSRTCLLLLNCFVKEGALSHYRKYLR